MSLVGSPYIESIVCLFSKTIKKILVNFIPRVSVICDDRYFSWLKEKIKWLINGR